MPGIQIGSGLPRALGLWQAVAANMVTMIGSAIFVTIPLVLSAMGGPQAFLGWALGMIIALADGLVWAELGVAMPAAGGTYVYLEEAFGRGRAGRLMSFISLWGSAISFPLISAFIARSSTRPILLSFPNQKESSYRYSGQIVADGNNPLEREVADPGPQEHRKTAQTCSAHPRAAGCSVAVRTAVLSDSSSLVTKCRRMFGADVVTLPHNAHLVH
jgi:amino acid transporter